MVPKLLFALFVAAALVAGAAAVIGLSPATAVACEEATDTGSAITLSIGIAASAMRLTNDVLAPFSSNRLTRYGRRSSWLPTGA